MTQKKTISMNCLSQSSIQNAIKQLRSYQDSLTYKCQLLAEKLAENGVEIARLQLADLDAIFTTELISSIHAEYKGSVKGGGIWEVVAGTDHAMFVEFGTGIVGKRSPYPGNLPEGVDWQYASGKTIRQLADGRYGWFYQDDNGEWWFTEGMPSRPFMYYTAIQLRDIVVKTAKEVFSG